MEAILKAIKKQKIPIKPAIVISNKLNATLIMSGYSRLLVDCNRPFGVSEAFIEKSENTLIPGNLNLTRKDKQYRAKKYCIPYRNRIDSILKSRIRNNIKATINCLIESSSFI